MGDDGSMRDGSSSERRQRPARRSPGFGWSKVSAVATREYLASVRTKAFLIALVMMPILTVSAALIPVMATQLNTGREKRVAVVDETGKLFVALSARLVNSQHESAEATVSGPLDVPARQAPPEGLELVAAGSGFDDATREELSNQVRTGRLFAWVVIPEAVLTPGSDTEVTYVTNTPTSRGVRSFLERSIESEVHRLRLLALGIDPAPIARAQSPVELVEGALFERRGGQLVEAREPNPLRDIALPMGAAFLLFMSVMLGATPLMQSTLEEKMHRITEVLVSSVPPLPLMLGKLLGAAAVSYTIVGLYLVGGVFVAAQVGALQLLSISDVLAIVFFQAVAFVMYGSFFLAVGSACSDLKETQSLMMPAIMLMTTPLLLLSVVLDEPNGPAATWLSLFPFFTPPLMLLRWLVSPGAPVWQLLLGGVLSVLTAGLCLFLSSRVFRVGLLMQGAAPSYRQLWRWIQHG